MALGALINDLMELEEIISEMLTYVACRGIDKTVVEFETNPNFDTMTEKYDDKWILRAKDCKFVTKRIRQRRCNECQWIHQKLNR